MKEDKKEIENQEVDEFLEIIHAAYETENLLPEIRQIFENAYLELGKKRNLDNLSYSLFSDLRIYAVKNQLPGEAGKLFLSISNDSDTLKNIGNSAKGYSTIFGINGNH